VRTQASTLVEPLGDVLPPAQAVQAALPTVFLYEPAEQATHDPGLPPYPATHAQLAKLRLPLTDVLNDGHAVHVPPEVP